MSKEKNENRIAGIYKIQNTINGKVYIGESLNIKERWNLHKDDLRNGTHHSYKLQSDWNEHGEDSFVFEIEKKFSNNDTTYATKINLILDENYYILKYNSLINGYNVQNTLNEILFNNKIVYTPYDKYNILKILILKQDFLTKYVLVDIAKYIKKLEDDKYYKFDIFKNMPHINYSKISSLKKTFNTLGVNTNDKINKDDVKIIIKYIVNNLKQCLEVFKKDSILENYKIMNNI